MFYGSRLEKKSVRSKIEFAITRRLAEMDGDRARTHSAVSEGVGPFTLLRDILHDQMLKAFRKVKHW